MSFHKIALYFCLTLENQTIVLCLVNLRVCTTIGKLHEVLKYLNIRISELSECNRCYQLSVYDGNDHNSIYIFKFINFRWYDTHYAGPGVRTSQQDFQNLTRLLRLIIDATTKSKYGLEL